MRASRAFVSRVIYYIGLPAVWLAFNGSTRAYVIVESSGQVLFVKSWFGNQKYKLPGGGIKKGEDPKAGAIRELAEETGILIDSKNLKPVLNIRQNYYGARYNHLVFISSTKSQIWPKAQKNEIMEAVWLSPQQINLKNSNQATIDALKAASLN